MQRVKMVEAAHRRAVAMPTCFLTHLATCCADDSVLYDARVVAELVNAYRLALGKLRREEAARRETERERLGSVNGPMLWYAHFDWAVHLP